MVLPISSSRRGGAFHSSSTYKTKQVFHTFEAAGYSPRHDKYTSSNTYFPHATITQDAIYQHLPITKSAYALRGCSSCETNRGRAIQIEIIWYASKASQMPDALQRNIARWAAFVAVQTGTPLRVPHAFERTSQAYGTKGVVRLTVEEWKEAEGIVGHQHVPCNTHWDPGHPPMDDIISYAENYAREYSCGSGADTPTFPTATCTGQPSGVCGDPDECSGTTVSGLCPGGANNKCCLIGSDDACVAAGGTCIKSGSACSGETRSGLCPGTSQIKCCVP